MKTFFFFLLLLIAGNISKADENIISNDQNVPSPDGRYTVRFIGGYSQNIQIHDNQLGRDFYSTVLTPVLALKWTGNSKAILAVEHMAGGSSAKIIYILDGATNIYNALPPNNGEFCKVVKDVIGWNKITLTYRVCSSRKGPYWTCTFDIDPKTGTISSIQTKIISLEEYKSFDS